MFILQNSEKSISLKGITHIKAHSFTLINLILCNITHIFQKTKEQYLWTFFVLPTSLHNLEKLNCFLNGSVEKNAVFFLVIKHKLILRVLNNIDWGDGFIQLLPLRTGSYSVLCWRTVSLCALDCGCAEFYHRHLSESHQGTIYGEIYTCLRGRYTWWWGAGAHTKARETIYTQGSDA